MKEKGTAPAKATRDTNLGQVRVFKADLVALEGKLAQSGKSVSEYVRKKLGFR